jgi:hypothetical protein
MIDSSIDDEVFLNFLSAEDQLFSPCWNMGYFLFPYGVYLHEVLSPLSSAGHVFRRRVVSTTNLA